MTATILNAAPMTRMLGTQDKSTRPLVPEAEALPQHLPKIYSYMQKGPLTPQLVVGASRSQMYGDASFDERGPYCTHATVLANRVNAKGNAAMYQRVKPIDAAPPATLRLMLDVLETQVDVYTRNADGSIQLDSSGNPKTTGAKIPGYKVKWVLKQVDTDDDGNVLFGAATQGPGDQISGDDQSVRYPILDLEVSSFGEWGNNQALKLYAPTVSSSQPIDDRLLGNEKVYPFRMAVAARASSKATAKTVETLAGEQFVDVCFKPGTIDKVVDKLVYAGDVFIQAYSNTTDPKFAPVFGPFGRMHVYEDQIESLLDAFYNAEKDYIDGFSDFTGEDGEEYRFNFVSGVSSHNVPYHTFQLVSGGNAVRLTENTVLYAAGGSDGTMNELLFADLVTTEVNEYANPNSVLMNDAKYPESIIYDSGFPLDTKKALCNFIGERKDTAVVLSTYTTTGGELTASEESSLAIALKTRLQMFPESEYFGTPVMRGMIVGRYGRLTGSQYRGKLPLTIEIAAKAADYMGASNGKWKSGYAFDVAPLNQVSMFTDINNTFTPATVRNKDWANGLVWVEDYDRSSAYFPALHTVYENDTSVLTGFFTMMACVELEKVGLRVRRKFSGRSDLTNAQLVEKVNQEIEAQTTGRFDGRFIIKPDTYFTDADVARGYSWTSAIGIYAPNMKTVGTLSIQAYRIEDLA
jgi:hypothetical protein